MLKCERCGYEWKPRVSNPRNCPGCKSASWDKPKEIEMALVQKATMVPAENVQTEARVIRDGSIVMVQLEYGWIRIDLQDNTFAVGSYEG